MKIAGLMLLSALLGGALLAQPAPRQNPPAPRANVAQEQKTPTGAELYQIHCGRCHQPPLTLSPKAARTVLRHMRTRALIPADQEKRLLQFLAP